MVHPAYDRRHDDGTVDVGSEESQDGGARLSVGPSTFTSSSTLNYDTVDIGPILSRSATRRPPPALRYTHSTSRISADRRPLPSLSASVVTRGYHVPVAAADGSRQTVPDNMKAQTSALHRPRSVF